MGKGRYAEPYVLRNNILMKYKQLGVELKCVRCGREIKVGDKMIRRGKAKRTVKFYCEECWQKMHLDLPEPTEEEIERGEVLTIPFLNLEEVMLK